MTPTPSILPERHNSVSRPHAQSLTPTPILQFQTHIDFAKYFWFERCEPNFVLLLLVCCRFVHAVCVSASFRCRCRFCSSDTQRTLPASTISLLQAGLWSQCDAPAQPSVFWPDQPRISLHARRSHWTGFHPWSLWHSLASLLTSLCDFPRQ